MDGRRDVFNQTRGGIHSVAGTSPGGREAPSKRYLYRSSTESVVFSFEDVCSARRERGGKRRHLQATMSRITVVFARFFFEPASPPPRRLVAALLPTRSSLVSLFPFSLFLSFFPFYFSPDAAVPTMSVASGTDRGQEYSIDSSRVCCLLTSQ